MPEFDWTQGKLPPRAAVSPYPPIRDASAFVERRFNHDILLEDEDRTHVRERWPIMAPFLVDQELAEQFMPFEQEAKRLKNVVYRLGSAAVILTLVALLGSALDLWRSPPSPTSLIPVRDTTTFLEVCGVLGLLTAFLASKYGPFRRRWLRNRFVTEVLRQWHFRQLLDLRVWRAAPQWQPEPFARQRALDFRALLQDMRGSVGQHLSLLVSAHVDPLGDVPKPHLPDHPTARRELLEAYRRLRLDHQIEFLEYKLSPDDRTFLGLSIEALVWLTDHIAGAALLLALGCSVATIVRPAAWAAFAAVGLAIVGVAVRAWRDGLALHAERERYAEMRHHLVVLRARWDAASTEDERFSVAEELEQTAVEELRAFARAHMTAQFLF